MRSLCVGASILLVVAVAACGSKPSATYSAKPAGTPAQHGAPWPAPPDPLVRTRLAGLKPETHEFFSYHVHAHLDVFVNGQLERVPAGIGINILDPAVKRGLEPDGTLAYGGITQCATPCISPLHTHADDGILHTESQRHRPNQLGDFFTEWNVRLSRSCVGGYCEPADPIAFFVDGQRYRGDPRTIQLTNHKDIVIVIGSPPKQIPSQFPS
ncbi:MAG TPA: hypothetical protein VF002_07090 [Gaiellaceae bacterium]